MKRDRVIIQSFTTAEDAEGVVKQVWGSVAEIEGVILPYGTERALKDYGFSASVRYRFFYKGQHKQLIVGNQIIYKDMALPIVYVADYGKAVDVLLDTHGKTLQRGG